MDQSGVADRVGLVRRSPGLAGLLAAQTISPFGDAMATTALILHVQATTGSATAVGLLLFAQAIPPLAAPFAGVIADRFSPGRLLSIGWLAQAVLTGLLALLLPPLGALLAVVFVLALVDTPLSAAVGRCIPAVVADDDLVAANALRSGTTTRNVRASRPSTSRVPDAANSNPARGGPSTVPSSCIPLRRALAATRSSSATTAGTHRPTAAESGVSTRARTKTTASRAPSGGSSSAGARPGPPGPASRGEHAARREAVRDHARPRRGQRRDRLREQQQPDRCRAACGPLHVQDQRQSSPSRRRAG